MQNSIKIRIADDLDIVEFKKSIPFISINISTYTITGNVLELKITEGSDPLLIENYVRNAMKRFVSKPEDIEVFFSINNTDRVYCSNVIDNKNIMSIDNGSISLLNKAALLFEYFDNAFKNMALKIGAIVEHYPTMLPISEYKKTGYLKNSPQYSVFCSEAIEDFSVLEKLNDSDSTTLHSLISSPKSALSPAACFHTYCTHKNQTFGSPTIFTFNQAVFRNEGRFNWNDFGRLKDYHVREIVFLGSNDFVIEKRKQLLNMAVEFLENLNINSTVLRASDSFIMPKMQKFKKFQLQEGSKYELLLNYSENRSIAGASFNIHGTAFTYPFNIRVKNVETPVTGCVGFGIERWVLAFIAQFGWDESEWPAKIKKFINEEK